MPSFRPFSHKDSNFRIRSENFPAVCQEIRNQRLLLETYIRSDPAFLDALKPIQILQKAPLIVKRMAYAARRVGVGPMAAVAGTIAQLGAEAALRAGAEEAIVENGGDIFLATTHTISIGLYAGRGVLARALALQVAPDETPLAVCSSSSRMGHSLSFGNCDLATVVAEDASLADAAATRACNSVSTPEDIDQTLELMMAIEGIRGILLIKDDRIGVAGKMPGIVRNEDARNLLKITRDPRAEPLPV